MGGAGVEPHERLDPVRSTRPYSERDDDEDDLEQYDERPSHPYTWLQLIVLALVAFVLGFLIMLLGSKATDDAAGQATFPVTADLVASVVTPSTPLPL